MSKRKVQHKCKRCGIHPVAKEGGICWHCVIKGQWEDEPPIKEEEKDG